MLPLKQQPPIKQPSSRERDRSRRLHRLVAHAKGLRGLWEQSAPVGCGGAVTRARLPGCDCICLLCPNIQLLSVARGESDLLDNSYSVSWGGSNHRWIEADILLFWCSFGISVFQICSSIRPFSSTYLIQGLWGLEPVPPVTEREAGYTTDRSPVCQSANN